MKISNDSMVDELDAKIIVLLQENARVSFADIGRIIGLSPSATRERIQKMEQHGVIKKYAVVLDHKLLGYHLEAFILIKVFHGQLNHFLSVIEGFPEIQEAHRITGNLNVHLKVILEDQLHLQRLIDQLMLYGETTTFLSLSQL